MAETVPPGIRRAAWVYAVDFTEKHEGTCLSMYDNTTGKQDVTVGTGAKLFREQFIADNAWVKDMFHDKDDSTKPITVADVQADFRLAAKIPRKGNINPSTHLIPEYEVLQLRTTLEQAHRRLVIRMTDDLHNLLQPARFGKTFEEFSIFPADAQVVCLSFSYGLPAWPFHDLKEAVRWKDFDWASREVWIMGAAFEKNVAHQTLFWNAARVLEEGLDEDRVWSQPAIDPARLPWKPFTETEIDLDDGTTTTTVHGPDELVAKPLFKEPVPAALKKKYPGNFKP